MNECFFCGPTANPLTEEHVWPKWVSKILFGQYNSDHFVHVRSEGDSTTGLWKSRYLQVTTDTVCDQCNNVWLSNFENNAVKPLATPLIEGNQDIIIKPAEQWTLAAWAFKMALLLEIAAKENPQPFFTAAERKQFRETLIPSEKVRVFLAKYEYGQHPAHAAIPLHTLTRRDDQQPFHLKISTITAGCWRCRSCRFVRGIRVNSSMRAARWNSCSRGKALTRSFQFGLQPRRAFDGRRKRR
jgi:hypothetical protein